MFCARRFQVHPLRHKLDGLHSAAAVDESPRDFPPGHLAMVARRNRMEHRAGLDLVAAPIVDAGSNIRVDGLAFDLAGWSVWSRQAKPTGIIDRVEEIFRTPLLTF